MVFRDRGAEEAGGASAPPIILEKKIQLKNYFNLFLGHRNLIKNKTQTAVINILNLHILIMT